ncbi:MvaI/BcnI family restriction endonuclease [Marinobacter sp. CHS3-4]|uniref:MvaI/BcnI family restriction endonuclease n=1 Tax=Marinobacter sp. CHS3-4 TaxID=3045174 RepID=UPI0024B57006|nr:MvaI/BcnI family restriction endonuclease [Marinobacter sp. CHS3-4]MDI9245980.1 MvaI/BcnI family restriction endonuclease [Marinobacter sp. CHS3-4]
MPKKIGTYDTETAKHAGLQKILDILSDLGAEKVYVKHLAPNDNSKNQPYFAYHLTEIPFIPTGETVASETTSNKSKATQDNKRAIKYQASMKLNWFDAEGRTYPAPNAKLIYYPQYPEVRFSGFLKGSKVQASKWMDPKKEGRAVNRWLILGVSPDETIHAYLVTPDCALATELSETQFFEASTVFGEINASKKVVKSTRGALIAKLLEIHQMGWIPGQKLGPAGEKEPYTALNAGGYTLEAELGVSPNGIAEPDFLGWEVKQFGVTGFPARGTKPTTLLTPEPNGGFYVDQGAQEFVRKYGYADKSGKSDRLNFGGKHLVNQACGATSLTMRITGFDSENSTITDAKGGIALLDDNDVVTASWSFAKLMDHWKRKHAQAVYVPSMRQPVTGGGNEYLYGKNIELGTGTDFEMLLTAFASGHVYYDPGIKLEGASSGKPKLKKRSQFRVSHKELYSLYRAYELIDITEA